MLVNNIQGKKFSKLKVISFVEVRKTHAYWLCLCSCGNKKEVRGSHLKVGNVTSCGCYAKKQSSIRLKKYTTSEAYKKEGNPAWKGEKASVNSIHMWVSRNYKKGPCKHCGEKKKPRDWALIHGFKYKQDRNNYIVLCRSCHLKYDYTPERRAKAKVILKRALKIRYEKRSGL